MKVFLQQKQGSHIGKDHEGIDQIRAFPYQVERHNSTNVDHHNIDDLVKKETTVSGDIAISLFSR